MKIVLASESQFRKRASDMLGVAYEICPSGIDEKAIRDNDPASLARSRPDLVGSFSKNSFIAMVEGVSEQALSLGLIDQRTWDKGIGDLYRATERDRTFCYTFFKAIAVS